MENGLNVIVNDHELKVTKFKLEKLKYGLAHFQEHSDEHISKAQRDGLVSMIEELEQEIVTYKANLFEERPVTAEITALTGGNVVKIWCLKRDRSARFILCQDGSVRVIGNPTITNTFSDEEWLAAMRLQ